MKVLIIEARPLNTQALLTLLHSYGNSAQDKRHSVATVGSVEEAGPDKTLPCDIVLLAPAYLSGARGLDAQRALRSVSKAPVITLFDDPGVSLEERAVATTGADEFLINPVSRKELLGCIERTSQRRSIPMFHVHKVLAAARRTLVPSSVPYRAVTDAASALVAE